MKQTVVFGGAFGDEGKGTVVDRLCLDSKLDPLVVRFSGGNQVSHTVGRDNRKHIFSNFGSGTISGAKTYWSRFCTVNPTSLLNELETLVSDGIFPFLVVDNKCPIVTPFDVLANRGDINNLNNGSCGHGYGTTIAREESFYSLQFEDLFFPSLFLEKFNLIKEYYRVKDFSSFSKVSPEMNLSFIEDCKNITRLPKFISAGDESILNHQNEIIFEGSQGLLLDQCYGFFPNVTRSNTGTTNLLPWLRDDVSIILCTRSYQTRHGNGFMTNEKILNNIFIDPTESNVDNPYQGKFRRSLLDLDLLRYGIQKDPFIKNHLQNVSVSINCLDHSKNDLRFTENGNILSFFNEAEFLSNMSTRLNLPFWGVGKCSDSRLIKRL